MGIKSTNRRPPSAQISISISQLLYIASAWPGSRESFSGIVRGSNLEVSARSGRNYHADWPVPPRCYGAPTTKMRLNQSMAPLFGTLRYTRALYGATSHKHSICKSNQICCAGHLLPIRHSSQCPLPLLRKFCYFRCFHQKSSLKGVQGNAKRVIFHAC